LGRRRDGNHTPQKSNSVQDSMGNEGNRYQIPDLNKTLINVTKEPSDVNKKIPQRGNIGEKKNTEKLMEKIYS
jgi:hypothetical protein